MALLAWLLSVAAYLVFVMGLLFVLVMTVETIRRVRGRSFECPVCGRATSEDLSRRG